MLMELTPGDVKTIGGALVGVLSVTMAALGFLMRTAVKIGRDAQKVATALESLTDIKRATDKIPVIERRLDQAEEAWRTTRSDIKHLLRGSRADINGEGEE